MNSPERQRHIRFGIARSTLDHRRTCTLLPRPALEWNTSPRLKYGRGIFSKRPGHCSRVVDPRKMTRSGNRSGHDIRSIESRCPPSSLTDDAVLIAPQAQYGHLRRPPERFIRVIEVRIGPFGCGDVVGHA